MSTSVWKDASAASEHRSEKRDIAVSPTVERFESNKLREEAMLTANC